MELKCGIDAVCPALKAENPGSRWPKTSLAALRDRARLTPEQLQMLNTICACVDAGSRVVSRHVPVVRFMLRPCAHVWHSVHCCEVGSQAGTAGKAARVLIKTIVISAPEVAAFRLCHLSYPLAQGGERGVCGCQH
jgi:hypothetical protein